MVLKRFFKFIFSDGYDYSRFQRGLFMSICLFPMLIWYPISGDTFGFQLMAIILPIVIVYVFQDFLAEKLGRLSDVRAGYTYEYVSVIYSFYIFDDFNFLVL